VLRDCRARGVTGARGRGAQVLLLPMLREVGRDPAEKKADIGSITCIRKSYLKMISASIMPYGR